MSFSFRLESDPMNRAQLERYSASSTWCGLNPALLGQFLPSSAGNRNITSTVTSGQASKSKKKNNPQQSGNGEAPPPFSSLGVEGLNTMQSIGLFLLMEPRSCDTFLIFLLSYNPISGSGFINLILVKFSTFDTFLLSLQQIVKMFWCSFQFLLVVLLVIS